MRVVVIVVVVSCFLFFCCCVRFAVGSFAHRSRLLCATGIANNFKVNSMRIEWKRKSPKGKHNKGRKSGTKANKQINLFTKTDVEEGRNRRKRWKTEGKNNGRKSNNESKAIGKRNTQKLERETNRKTKKS